MADISVYSARVLAEEDKPLFEEAVVSTRNGAARGSYILIWLSCAESLKRKFREASTRDNAALQIVNEIEAVEANKQSADALILQRAKEYELIDDVVFQKLEYVYRMRCVYGHPYESAPSDEEIVSAASIVVDEVLGRPTLYRKKYVETLIERLTTNVDFLEPSKTSVAEYAREISVRIDPSRYKQVANSYSSKVERMYADPSLATFVARGIWFLAEFLRTVGTEFETKAEWHDFVLGCPKTSQVLFLSSLGLFDAIGRRARDSIISYALTHATIRPSGIKRLELLWEQGKLSEAQKRIYEGLDLGVMKAAGLKTTTAYVQIIDGLKSRTWPIQNPAADMLLSNDRVQLGGLTPEQQENLGRNILQAADGTSGSAINYLVQLSADHAGYPEPFIKGVLLEGFINEANGFRLKKRGLSKICDLFSDYPGIVHELLEKMDSATPTGWTNSDDYTEVIALINTPSRCTELADYLTQNRERFLPDPGEGVPF